LIKTLHSSHVNHKCKGPL